jgi:hypothetical protein
MISLPSKEFVQTVQVVQAVQIARTIAPLRISTSSDDYPSHWAIS